MHNSAKTVSNGLERAGFSALAWSQKRWLPPLLLVVSSMLLVSCDDPGARQRAYDRGHADGRAEGLEKGHEAGYKEGHEAGLKEGLEKGHEAGYKEGHEAGLKEGLEKGHTKGFQEGKSTGTTQGRADQRREDWNTLYAGNHTIRAVWLQWVEAAIVSLAAIAALGLLGMQILRLVLDSATPAQLTIKSAVAVGGGVGAFWVADRLGLFALGVTPFGLTSFFLAPAPTFILWHFVLIMVAFFPCLLALWYSGIFLRTPRNYASRAAVHVAIYTIIFTVLAPVFLSCFNTPDIGRFRIFDLALGFIGASVFYALWPVLQTAPNRR